MLPAAGGKKVAIAYKKRAGRRHHHRRRSGWLGEVSIRSSRPSLRCFWQHQPVAAQITTANQQ